MSGMSGRVIVIVRFVFGGGIQGGGHGAAALE